MVYEPSLLRKRDPPLKSHNDPPWPGWAWSLSLTSQEVLLNSLFKKAELLANVAVVVLATVAVVVSIDRLIERRSLNSQAPRIPGSAPTADLSKLPKLGVDWSRTERTLLLSLSKDCHFCTDSAPFYQRLGQIRAKNPNVRLVAFFPQSVGEGQEYLQRLGVQVDEVRQYPSGEVVAKGTPTLILVDRRGEVLGTWVGKLSPDKETEVARRVE
jgi:hypothetical protein